MTSGKANSTAAKAGKHQQTGTGTEKFPPQQTVVSSKKAAGLGKSKKGYGGY